MKSFTKFITLLYLSFFITTGIKAQNFLPFVSDNYAGASGMFYQPASIVDSRYKFDMELFGFSSRVDNNWVGVDKDLLFNLKFLSEEGLKTKDFTQIVSDDDKNVLIDMEFKSLNFMLSLNEKNSIGFSTRGRLMMNFNNMPKTAADLTFNLNNITNLYNQNLDFNDVSQVAASWVETGLTYSRVILDGGKSHFLKGGFTGKYLMGMGSLYLYEKEINYTYLNADTAANAYADIKFGLTSGLDELMNFKVASEPSFGFDVGFVYEWRPRYKEYKYNMDGEYDLWRRDQNKYKLRVGVSLIDVGSMKFKKQYNSNDFIINVDTLNFNNISFSDLTFLGDSVLKYFSFSPDGSEYYNLVLPTTLNINLDYNIWKKFYLNTSARIAFNQGTKVYSKLRYFSSYSITPRWESKMYGASIPISINQYGIFNMGLGLRLGPVWIGSSDLAGLIGIKDETTGLDFHIALKIPVLYKHPKDRDQDYVSDKKDRCPDEKGLYGLDGCPDSDSDGIENSKDECPYTAGKTEFSGCPDTDNDGVQDKFDECPSESGSKLFAGCPDTDNDGVIDKLDSCKDIAGLVKFGGCPDQDYDEIPDNLDDCPEISGLYEFNGCPDTDNDGVRDVDDLCPTVAGLDSLAGCPYIDTDNDGIQDKYDACPKIAGPITNRGCPLADTDKDGVPDVDDVCPMTPGPVENQGCPVIEVAEQEILNTAFSNLEFETNKSIIKSSSFSSLDELVELMKQKPDYRLIITGHTDNVGNDAANMSLSQNRALSVRNYLINNGVPAENITAKWYGETMPIADNETYEGRQKNRRVELKVVFD